MPISMAWSRIGLSTSSRQSSTILVLPLFLILFSSGLESSQKSWTPQRVMEGTLLDQRNLGTLTPTAASRQCL